MSTPITYVGIDVSARTLDIAIVTDESTQLYKVDNKPEGYKDIVKRLAGQNVRICLEATGFYSLDLANALHVAQLPCMVVNPRAARHFLNAITQRAKTDPIDAKGLAQYARSMKFRPWVPPDPARRVLCLLGRRREDLVAQITAESNRLEGMMATRESPAIILDDIKAQMEFLKGRLQKMEEEMMRVVEADPDLREVYNAISGIKGIKEKAGLSLLGELLLLPEDMTGSEVVAHAGLDPRTRRSGTSVRGAPTISRNGNPRLRSTMYMVALVATQHEPAVRAKYLDLVERRGKPKKLSLVAIMRKLLLTVWSLIKSRQKWDGIKFGAVPAPGVAKDAARSQKTAPVGTGRAGAASS